MKQDVVREELEKRSRLLELHLQQQFDELDLVQQSKADLINKAHQLAEKYEDAVESQEKFVNRSFSTPISFISSRFLRSI